jgi:CRP/FNR family transcriptional regulator
MCRLCLKEWLPAIDANRESYHFKKGELLFREGDKVNGIYFIYSGKVKVHKHWGEEKELIVRIARQGDIVGHRGLGKDIYYPVSGTALEPVNACFIDLDFFTSTLKINHDFIFELLLFFAGELKESEKNMRNLAHMPVKGRVAQAILNLQNKFGVNEEGMIDLTLSRQDLASFAGTTYETVFRIINELTNDGIIRLEGKDIAIVEIEKLKELTKE